ncbi:DinB family protein [Leptobacterium flavescens]|uniref:DinB family protein n=1 Tax=Leptobacterium flavescens TaxID=472055 RepID=A0A6P0UL82_9FLAO|nr:DinB family protein [Leptobacterium flavescens]NER14121.1 DinB family protein [Leptobacterium flavescens]
MKFNKERATEVLERTPKVLRLMLEGISLDWQYAREGENTWAPIEIISHLILGEKTDWIPRTLLILSDQPDKNFKAFNMTAHLDYCKGKTIEELLDEFEDLRKKNMEIFRSLDLNKENLDKTGIHIEFGEVTLRQHLSTWVAHDLGHIAQISRVMAKQYKEEVGPWTRYLSILNK